MSNEFEFHTHGWYKVLSGAFAKLRKATICFVMSVRPSIRLEQLGSHWTNFYENWYASLFFEDILRKFKFHSNTTRKRILHMKTFSHLWQHLAESSLEWEMFQIKVVEKIRTHILCSIIFARKLYRLWDNVEKCGGASQAAEYGACAQAHVWAPPPTHTHTQKYVVLIAFPRQQWFRKRVITLYVHCLSISQIWEIQCSTQNNISTWMFCTEILHHSCQRIF